MDVPTSTVVRAITLGVVVLGTAGFLSAGKTVTLSVDGQAREVRTHASTVSGVLEAEGLVVGEHDTVLPAPTAQVADGDTIDVRHGRLVVLTVDGVAHQVWTTADTVDELTASLGARFASATLTASRSQRIPLTGLTLSLATLKEVVITHDGRTATFFTAAPTVAAALAEAGVALVGRDLVRPVGSTAVTDGLAIRVVRVAARESKVRTSIRYTTRRTTDSSLYKGESRVVRAGRDGVRVTMYVVTTHDGDVVSRQRVGVVVLRAPTSRVVAYGTKVRHVERRVFSGSRVDSLNWAALARCESSGNPRAIGGGGIYFGLYQFNLSTWHGVGGRGNPIDASPSEQTYRAKILYRDRGSQPWPACGYLLYT